MKYADFYRELNFPPKDRTFETLFTLVDKALEKRDPTFFKNVGLNLRFSEGIDGPAIALPKRMQQWIARLNDSTAVLAHIIYYTQILLSLDPKPRMEYITRYLDNILNDERKPDSTCKAGCSFCCHIGVDITIEEAQHITRTTLISPQRLRSFLHSRQRPDKDFLKLPKAERACIFLRDDRCSIYHRRPLACRIHNSVSDPKQCDTDAHPGAAVHFHSDYQIEILHSALMQISPLAPIADATALAPSTPPTPRKEPAQESLRGLVVERLFWEGANQGELTSEEQQRFNELPWLISQWGQSADCTLL